jgi:putative MATE family efflux protein
VEDKTHKKLTEGPILKSIIYLAIPILIGNLLQTAFQITDEFWLGRLGADAIASVAVCFPILFFIMNLSAGIGLGGGVLVSQYKGRNDKEKISNISGQTLLLAFIASLVFSIIGYIFAPQILSLFNVEPTVFSGAVSYLRISFIGIISVFGFMVYQSLSRAAGDAKTPVYIILVSVILNLILDPFFIFGYSFIPALGVGGAAMATVATQTIALIGGLVVLFRGKKDIHLRIKDFKINKGLIKGILTLGVPISLEQSSRSIGFILLVSIATTFGTVALASYGIGTQMLSLVIIPALSLSIANSALIGSNIGAGKIERAEKIAKLSTIFGFIILSIIGILFFIFAPHIVGIFIPGSPEVIKEGALFIRIIALTFGFIGIQMSILGTIRGAGNAKTTLYLTVSVIVVQFTSAYLLSTTFSLGALGLYIAFPIANIYGATIAYIVFSRGKWKDKRLIDTPEIHKKIEEEVLAAECE